MFLEEEKRTEIRGRKGRVEVKREKGMKEIRSERGKEGEETNIQND